MKNSGSTISPFILLIIPFVLILLMSLSVQTGLPTKTDVVEYGANMRLESNLPTYVQQLMIEK